MSDNQGGNNYRLFLYPKCCNFSFAMCCKIDFTTYICKVNQINNDLKRIKMSLLTVKPYLPTGASKSIAEKANIPYTEVTRMLNGLVSKRTPIVLKATVEYLEDLEANTAKAKQELQKVIESGQFDKNEVGDATPKADGSDL